MSPDYDVVVIGGGIQGAGVMQAMAAAGYKVLLLEKQAIAAATSSSSSKLIHGGLRYLETGQFTLVRKALQEREVLLKIAPELVRRKPFYIPVYVQTSRRPWKIASGLMLYALLGGLHHNARFRRLRREQWSQLDGLRHDNLQQVFQYWDAQTDDVALTRAVVRSALQLGGELRCPATFCGAQQTSSGFRLDYAEGDSQHTVTCTVMVNAAGPWVNQVLQNIKPVVTGIEIELVQGTHILLDAPAPQGVYYVEAKDQRVVFIMPWQAQTLVGTTESPFVGSPNDVRPPQDDVDYLLKVYGDYFPEAQTRVVDKFAGLRVLPRQASSAFKRPRDTILYTHPAGVVSLYGGKLTSYRATALQVLETLRPLLPSVTPRADTMSLRLVANGADL